MGLSASWAEPGVLLSGCYLGSHPNCAPGLSRGCGDPALGAGEGRPRERLTGHCGVLLSAGGDRATQGPPGNIWGHWRLL